jgi:hypothetical protein
LAAREDGVVTVGETKAMPSLIVALADSYNDIQQPRDPESPEVGFHLTVLASGVLQEDGRPFCVHLTRTKGLYKLTFEIGE